MKVIVAFSGGKDSMAALLWVRNNLTKDFITVFADTAWESDETYQYIKDVTKQLNLNTVEIKSQEVDGFVDMARKKKRFPSAKARFCTEILKSKPMINFILDEIQDDILIIQGIRAQESAARSKMEKQCSFFKFYRQPYGTDNKGKPKFHTYRKKEVQEYISMYSDDILRPVFDWSGQQVIDYIIENGFDPNPLYKKGMKRVGCFPCVMCSHAELKALIDFHPERVQLIKELEQEIGSSFFGPGKIPSWACSSGSYPTIADIEKYINGKNATPSLFHEQENASCMSYYGLCE